MFSLFNCLNRGNVSETAFGNLGLSNSSALSNNKTAYVAFTAFAAVTACAIAAPKIFLSAMTVAIPLTLYVVYQLVSNLTSVMGRAFDFSKAVVPHTAPSPKTEATPTSSHLAVAQGAVLAGTGLVAELNGHSTVGTAAQCAATYKFVESLGSDYHALKGPVMAAGILRTFLDSPLAETTDPTLLQLRDGTKVVLDVACKAANTVILSAQIWQYSPTGAVVVGAITGTASIVAFCKTHGITVSAEQVNAFGAQVLEAIEQGKLSNVTYQQAEEIKRPFNIENKFKPRLINVTVEKKVEEKKVCDPAGILKSQLHLEKKVEALSPTLKPTCGMELPTHNLTFSKGPVKAIGSTGRFNPASTLQALTKPDRTFVPPMTMKNIVKPFEANSVRFPQVGAQPKGMGSLLATNRTLSTTIRGMR